MPRGVRQGVCSDSGRGGRPDRPIAALRDRLAAEGHCRRRAGTEWKLYLVLDAGVVRTYDRTGPSVGHVESCLTDPWLTVEDRARWPRSQQCRGRLGRDRRNCRCRGTTQPRARCGSPRQARSFSSPSTLIVGSIGCATSSDENSRPRSGTAESPAMRHTETCAVEPHGVPRVAPASQ